MKQSELEQTYLLLVRFLMLAKRRAAEMGAQNELTGMQTMLVFLLDEPHPMYNFKRIFNCDASNITGLVDGLEQKGLASRFPDPGDRRIKMVKLTAKGAKLRAKLLGQTIGDSFILSKLDAAELKTFTSILKKITNDPNVL